MGFWSLTNSLGQKGALAIMGKLRHRALSSGSGTVAGLGLGIHKSWQPALISSISLTLHPSLSSKYSLQITELNETLQDHLNHSLCSKPNPLYACCSQLLSIVVVYFQEATVLKALSLSEFSSLVPGF